MCPDDNLRHAWENPVQHGAVPWLLYATQDHNRAYIVGHYLFWLQNPCHSWYSTTVRVWKSTSGCGIFPLRQSELIFQRDNAQLQTTYVTMICLQSCHTLSWSAKSFDLALLQITIWRLWEGYHNNPEYWQFSRTGGDNLALNSTLLIPKIYKYIQRLKIAFFQARGEAAPC